MADLSIDQMRSWWDDAARTNAPNAVLSNQAHWDLPEFYKTGEAQVAEHRAWAESHIGLDDAVRLTGDRALDFACGLGRMTRPWASTYSRVTGIDISQEMISQAQANNPPANVDFSVAPGYPLTFDSATFDFSYSHLAIQHIPSSHSLHYVAELLRVIKPGAYSLFDLIVEAFGPLGPGLFAIPLPLVILAARNENCILLGYRALYLPCLHTQFLFQKLRS